MTEDLDRYRRRTDRRSRAPRHRDSAAGRLRPAPRERGCGLLTETRPPSRLHRFFDASFLHVARNSSWSAAGTLVNVAVFFAETVILARYLGAASFGVFVLVIAYAEAIQLFFDFRTREAMTRYLGEFLARAEGERAVAVAKLLWLVDVAVVLSAFLLVTLTAPLVAPHLTDDPHAATLIQIYAVAVLCGGLDATAGAVLRVFDRFRLAFLAGLGSILFRLGVTFALVLGGAGLEGLVWGRVAGEILTTLLLGSLALTLLKQAFWPYRHAPLRSLQGQRREIFRFLLHMNLQGSIKAAATKVDVLSVGLLAGPSAASVYKVGVQFGSTPLLFADPLFIAVYPLFSRWHALGRDLDIRAVGRKLSTALSLVAVPTAVVLAVESEAILAFLVGDDFAGAAVPMAVVLLGVLPTVVLFWGRAAMLSWGDAQTATAIVTVGTAVQFALLLALTPRYGATGAAVGLALSGFVGAVLYLRYLRRRELL